MHYVYLFPCFTEKKTLDKIPLSWYNDHMQRLQNCVLKGVHVFGLNSRQELGFTLLGAGLVAFSVFLFEVGYHMGQMDAAVNYGQYGATLENE